MQKKKGGGPARRATKRVLCPGGCGRKFKTLARHLSSSAACAKRVKQPPKGNNPPNMRWDYVRGQWVKKMMPRFHFLGNKAHDELRDGTAAKARGANMACKHCGKLHVDCVCAGPSTEK